MADKRITDFTEAASAGADYYLVTDSLSDGVKKIKPANIVPAYTGDVTSTAGGTVNTIAANVVTNAKAAQMAAGTIKSNLTAALANSSDNTINAVMDAAFGATRGAVAYRGAVGWSSLAPGVSGQFMQTSGPLADPIWQTIPGGGNMLSTNNLSDVSNKDAALGYLGIFDTAALATAASPTTKYIRIEDENAQATYLYDAATSSAATITTANARKYRNIEKVLTPKMFGAIGDGATDDTAALQALTAEIQWRGGCRVEMGDAKTYKVWTTTPATQSVLMNFSSLKKLRMNFNGSQITHPINFTSNNIILYWMLMKDCENIEINHPQFDQTAYHVLDSAKGTHGIYLQDYCRDVRVHDLVQTGGISGLNISRSGSFNRASRARDIFFTSDLNYVAYGLSAQKNGDQIEAKYRTRNAERSYFPYNVRQHKVTLDSTNAGPFDDVLLKVYASSTETNAENTLSDIDFHYSNLGRPVSNPGTGSLIRIGIDQGDATTASGFIRNIYIKYEVDTGANTTPPLLATTKATSTGTSDTTARGHILTNINISGFANLGTQSSASLELFTNNGTNSLGDWSGDTIEHVNFKNLSIYGTSAPFNFNTACIDRGLSFENVYVEGTPSLGVVPTKLLDVSRNVKLGALLSFSESGTPGAAGYVTTRRLPNGGLEICGATSATNGANTAVAFPTSFSAIPDVTATSTGAGLTTSINAVSITASGFSINNPSASTIIVHWRAVGYV